MTKKVQYCRCRINLAGQNHHIVIIDEINPVTWPELQVIMALHGDENVMDIMPCGVGEVWPTEEKNRLIGKYGSRIVEACFPGRNFRMEFMMTGEENLPVYTSQGGISTKVHPPHQNGDDDEDDDGEDEVAKALAAGKPLEPIFKPGRAARPQKEA